ncbi:MAG: DUF362 domain-containing protein [Candidatus Eisenbacteria bacterium]|uniref:DUF362 domain-containing protein n=1 Tax=Eiseniibacteriota bacterium TaxID=2212470 RepID=A0A948RWW9_UNCEI|nr:DUF362 domain-containing protein [Candidatus Eisenbacteria bacterium]MBU1949898.1 DUF362 domain-containing protein [Candidatus Eisenbacteria bacterium]MBU2692355.1 DUF362 domain-containing protein [Candidatus Eisenbacteria bacterium]
MSKVYLVPAQSTETKDQIHQKIRALWRQAGLANCFRKQDLAALKLHVGEPGREPHLSPVVAAALVDCMKEAGARPFLTDTAVLYKSRRDNGVDHAQVAYEHGFSIEGTGAPFIPTDGLNGSEEIEVTVSGKHYKTVAIASAAIQARSMLVLTHATGHLGTGFGGALKNLGMGLSAKKGKLRQHSGQHPHIDLKKCTSCGTCAVWCPENAITVNAGAEIVKELCIGCGECVAMCLDGAVRFDWTIMGRELQERIVEHAAAVVRGKPGRIGYVTVAMGITKDCDCLSKRQDPLCEDIGILASHDPVAIDLAVMELVKERAGRTLESMSYPDRDGMIQIHYAAELGLGQSSAELVLVD